MTTSRWQKPALAPTKQRINKRPIFSFDIETHNNNKTFTLSGIYGQTKMRNQYTQGKIYQKTYYSADDMIDDWRTNPIFRNCYMVAHNLSFDFYGTLFGKMELKNFRPLFQKTTSNLICVKVYFDGDKFSFTPKRGTKSLKSMIFLDSMNYIKKSLKEIGKIINVHKSDAPVFLGKKPKDKEEWQILKEYNMQDNKVCFEFMRFFIRAVEELGGTFKMTIASIAMALFRNKYLKGTFYRASEEDLLFQLKSFYGGMTQAFMRGHITCTPIEKWSYYDFNSLYPSVMRDILVPDLNTLHHCYDNTQKWIMEKEGCSDVEITAPKLKYGYLPCRMEGHTVYLQDCSWRGVYTHYMLRQALALGYRIDFVYRCDYYEKSFNPFKTFVEDLYAKRLLYQADKNAMESVVKAIMNSLFGKFAQQWKGMVTYIPVTEMTKKMFDQFDDIEVLGGYYVCKYDGRPPAISAPIWSSYVTSYAITKLYSTILACEKMGFKVAYSDTDSLITTAVLPTSEKLGDLKLEMEIEEAYIVKSKHYAIKGTKFNKDGSVSKIESTKIKGIRKFMPYEAHNKLLFEAFNAEEDNIEIDDIEMFAKYKSCLRNHKHIPNELFTMDKELSLEDTKRQWEHPFNPNELQCSTALTLRNGEVYHKPLSKPIKKETTIKVEQSL